MREVQFYEIKSKKSEEFINGVRQVTLSSVELPQINCFLWFGEIGEMKHFQIIFDEKLLEWHLERGFSVSVTNRRSGIQEKIGVSKGSRTIHAVEDNNILKEGLEIIKNSVFPEDYIKILKQTLAVQ